MQAHLGMRRVRVRAYARLYGAVVPFLTCLYVRFQLVLVDGPCTTREVCSSVFAPVCVLRVCVYLYGFERVRARVFTSVCDCVCRRRCYQKAMAGVCARACLRLCVIVCAEGAVTKRQWPGCRTTRNW